MLGFLLYFKLAYLLFHVSEPFAPFENLFCAVAMGGIWDALSRYGRKWQSMIGYFVERGYGSIVSWVEEQ